LYQQITHNFVIVLIYKEKYKLAIILGVKFWKIENQHILFHFGYFYLMFKFLMLFGFAMPYF